MPINSTFELFKEIITKKLNIMKHNNLLCFFLAVSILFLQFSCKQSSEEKVDEIHQSVLTVDTHCDTPLMLRRSDYDLGKRHDVNKRGGGRVDFIRMRDGKLDAMFFAVFTGQGKRTPDGYASAKQSALNMFASIKKSLKKYPDLAELALTPDDAYRIEKDDKRAIFIGVENGYPIGKDISMVNDLFNRGARYITLCHTANNDICDSSNDSTEHGGLSDFGRQVVEEMNRLGMMVDVSHISDAAFYDVIETSKAPVMASHSCARALCDNPRNMTDDMIKKLAENNGVIQICFYTGYVKDIEQSPERDSAYSAFREKYKNYEELSDTEKAKATEEWYLIDEMYPENLATVADMVDHIDHVVELVGIDYVGIGTDFDGGGALEDCKDVSQMQNVTKELVNRGYNKEQIEKIWGGNFMRVFREVQEVAEM